MKHEDIIRRMTLEEKCSLLSGETNFGTKTIQRLNVPAMQFSDGPSGLRRQEGSSDQLGIHGSVKATCYPCAAAMANSWDEKMLERLGTHIGAEARAQRVNVLLGPGLNLKRSPLCGRNFEYFSEDPYLSGKLAAAYIRGVQSEGVSACPKHFAVNSQEHQRMHVDSVLDERTLRENYLTGFEIAVREGKPWSLMSSYNRVGGEYASESKKLLRDILVDEWGFEGLVVTDWGGSNDRVSGVLAGNHVEMPASKSISDIEVLKAVKAGNVSEALLDKLIDEYLDVLFITEIPEDAPKTFDENAHHAFAREAAEEAIVLLKNEGGILPLDKQKRVAVIGEMAKAVRYQGAGSSRVNPTGLDIPLDMLRESGANIIGYAQGYRNDGKEDSALQAEALSLAETADVVIAYMGLTDAYETEGMDRENLRLPENQVSLINALAGAKRPIVAVLCGGAPFEMPWIDKVQGLINGYLGGQSGAGAMADALLGKVNPSGKLAETWTVNGADVPCTAYYPGRENTAEYREGIFVGYRYYQKARQAVRFPFGFGLSYTGFSYESLEASEGGVSFTVTNTGKHAGAEIAQVYIAKKASAVFRPEQELKGFARVYLEAGESRRVAVPFDDKAFRFYNVRSGAWEVESGEYEARVGASCEDIRLSGTLALSGKSAEGIYSKQQLLHYFSGQVKNVPDEEFAALLGHAIPNTSWDKSAPLTREDTLSQLRYAKRWYGRAAARVIRGLLDKSIRQGKPDLNLLFQWNMPFRAIARMSGMLDIAMVDSVLEMLNGHFHRGIVRLIRGLFTKNREKKAFEGALSASEQVMEGKE